MSDTVKYPEGIPFRTPRPRNAEGGAMLGLLLGYAVTQNVGGALGGSALGGLLGNKPASLHQALRQNFNEKGLQVINFYRRGRFAAKILFRYQEKYWTLESNAPQHPEMNIEQIEDWLYGDLIEQAEDFLNQNNLRIRP